MPWPRPRATKSTRNTMCGTSASALRPYTALRTRTTVNLGPRDGAWLGACSVAALSDGQAFQLSTVRTADKIPKPYQLCLRPCCSNSGTRVPDAAMPRPTPAKITPPTRPRLPGATCGKMVDAAKTMITPPVSPATKRQPKNQMNEIGTELLCLFGADFVHLVRSDSQRTR